MASVCEFENGYVERVLAKILMLKILIDEHLSGAYNPRQARGAMV